MATPTITRCCRRHRFDGTRLKRRSRRLRPYVETFFDKHAEVFVDLLGHSNPPPFLFQSCVYGD